MDGELDGVGVCEKGVQRHNGKAAGPDPCFGPIPGGNRTLIRFVLNPHQEGLVLCGQKDVNEDFVNRCSDLFSF